MPPYGSRTWDTFRAFRGFPTSRFALPRSARIGSNHHLPWIANFFCWGLHDVTLAVEDASTKYVVVVVDDEMIWSQLVVCVIRLAKPLNPRVRCAIGNVLNLGKGTSTGEVSSSESLAGKGNFAGQFSHKSIVNNRKSLELPHRPFSPFPKLNVLIFDNLWRCIVHMRLSRQSRCYVTWHLLGGSWSCPGRIVSKLLSRQPLSTKKHTHARPLPY